MLRRFATAVAALGLSALSAAAAPGPWQNFNESNPGAEVFAWRGEISRVYGRAFSHGATVEASAEAFIDAHAKELFGVEPAELRLVPASEEWAFQPVMYDPDRNDFKFYAVHYAQVKDGTPVFESRLTLLVRNEAAYPLVLARPHKLVDLTNFDALALAAPRLDALLRDWNVVGEPETVIYVDDRDVEEGEPRLAHVFITQVGRPGDPVKQDIHGQPARGSYDRRLVVIDATTGEVLRDESIIRTIDVVGNVSGKATPGLLPDRLDNPPQLFVLPNLRVNIVGGNAANTDDFGDFIIVHGGVDPVTVHSDMRGPSLSSGVFNMSGGEIFIDLNVTPPGPADFLHNPAPTEFDTAQVNAMLQSSVIHTFIGDINPAFPGLARSFRANVNIADTCNAYYDGSSINFYRAGGGCVNTAYSTVIYHEYGHKLVGDGASFPSGDYHEGMADAVSQVLTDDPITGAGFRGPGTYVRTGDNNRSYPCGGEVHYCGQVVSGCVWHTRDALTVTEPVAYLDIIRNLTINQILIHSGGVDPGITIDFLTLDDDDGDIGNGTPHYDEINEGFSRHNMPAPPLEWLEFTYPDGLPEVISIDGGTTVRVEVAPDAADPVPGTGMLHYDLGGGFQSVSMTEISPNVYDAVFPPVACETVVEYYFSAETTGGELGTGPLGAPDLGVFTAYGARSIAVAFEDNFETDKGWTVENIQLEDGPWGRGIPIGGGDRGDPPSDFDGSGRCYLTDNVDGNSDVDGGPTILTSPTFAIDGVAAVLSYARWFTNDDNDQDRLTVKISNDDGANWVTIEQVPNTVGWVQRFISVTDYVTPTATMKLRFEAVDNPNDSVTEAAADAIEAIVINCNEMFLEVDLLVRGEPADLTAKYAEPGETVYFVYSLVGEGQTFVPALGVTLGLERPQLAGSAVADGDGVAVFTTIVPRNAGIRLVWLQAAHAGRVSNVVLTQTN